MAEEPRISDLLKIPEAARYLDVTRRWIYRRIWSGDLPASKVGGLYFIHKQDIDALVEQGKISPVAKAAPEAQEPVLKCGYCFRLLESDTLIGDVCQSENCEQLICSQCLADSIHFCVEHLPDKVHLWETALVGFRQGRYPLLVKASQARLREVNFVQRFQTRLSSIGTLRHPMTDEMLMVTDWEACLEEGDERAELMRLMNKVVLEAEWISQVPLNAWARYRLPIAKKQKGAPVGLLAHALSRSPEMLQKGFDTHPLGAEDLTGRLLAIGREAQSSQTITLALLASTTGWDTSARELVQGEATGTAFAHRWLMVYLYDMESREMLYNRLDSRLRGFAEVFIPLLPAEEIEEIIRLIEREMGIYDSLTMQHASQAFPFSEKIILKAFEQLAVSGRYALTELPDLGPAIIRIYS
jgi:excisionase family DNA binding protein